MSHVRITTRYTDGTATEIEVGATGEHPDLLDELATRATRIHVELMGTDTEVEDDGDR